VQLVVIESPYAGVGWWPLSMWRRWRNVRYARRCLRDSIMRGEAPLASHLLYTQRGILRDHVVEERERGIAAGLAWGQRADYTVVYFDRGISRGMLLGIQAAHAAQRVVTFRSIYEIRAK